jgi:hypothetical protein
LLAGNNLQHRIVKTNAMRFANVGGGRLTERASSDVGGSRGLDRVERRLRAAAANIPLSSEDKGDWGIRREEKERKGEKKC